MPFPQIARISFVFFLAGLSGVRSVCRADSLPVTGYPDVYSANIAITYDASSSLGELKAIGVSLTVTDLNGLSSDIWGDFNLDVMIDKSTGKAVSGNVKAADGTLNWFYSENIVWSGVVPGSTVTDPPVLAFEFTQASKDAGNGGVPVTGSLFAVKLNGINLLGDDGMSLSSGPIYSSNFHSSGGAASADTAVVTPLPKTVVSGVCLFVLTALVRIVGNRSKRKISPA